MVHKSLRRVLKSIVFLPVSPRVFSGLVSLLRTSRLFKKRSAHPGVIRRIFVSHPYSSVGDLVLLLPLLESVARHWPDAIIDVAVGRSVEGLLRCVRNLGQVFLCRPSSPNGSVVYRYQRVWNALTVFKREIIQRDYDLAIVPRWGTVDTSLAVYLAYLTDAPVRCGYSATVDGGIPEVDKLLTHVAKGGQHEQEALRNVMLLERTGLVLADAEDTSVSDRPIRALVELAIAVTAERDSLRPPSLGLASGYCVVAPGASSLFRMWPVDRFSELMEIIHRQFSLSFFIVGSSADTAVSNQLAERFPEYCSSLAGKTNLQQLTSLVRQARLFLGNDSGAAHIAGALGIPTVIVSPFPQSCHEEHTNSPVRFRPCGPLVRVVQPANPRSPCFPVCSADYSHCINEVSVERVFAAVQSLL